MTNNIIKQLGYIAIGSRLKRLSDKINLEISRLFKEQHFNVEPSWLPVIFYLNENVHASILDIASALNFTHPAAINIVNQMEKKNLVEAYQDVKDKRKRLVKLNAAGQELLVAMTPMLEELKLSAGEILNSAGYDFMHVIDSIEKSLDKKSLNKRTSERIKQKLIDSIDILRFSPAYKEQFKILNIEWLQKYFEVETEDEKILSNPEEIISGGGEIFFVIVNDEAVGTCAVIKKNEYEFELAKMAVTEKAQGRQAGKKLALAAIGFAYSKGAKTLYLETSRKLIAAVNLYEKLGFEYVPHNAESKYKRETIKMKLDLGR